MDYRKLHLLLRYGREYGHRRIKEKGFTDTEHLICSYVYVNELCSQDDIAKSVGMDKTTVGKAIDSLESKGFLIREQSKDDKRKKALQLTAEGKSGIADILSINDEWMQNVLSALSNDEQALFLEYLSRVLDTAEKIYLKSEEKHNAQ